jgi:hypothetical protein
MLVNAEATYADAKKFSIIEMPFTKFIKNEIDFINNIDPIFSIEGFQQLKNKLFYPLPCPKLIDFVFEITSGKIYLIPQNMYTPNEIVCSSFFLDKPHRKNYLSYYDGKKINNPSIGNDLIETCDFIHANKDLKKLKNLIVTKNLRHLAQCVKLSDSLHKSSITTSSFFKISKSKEEFYLKNVTNRSLLLLNKITNVNFTAKMRFYPNYTVDAIYPCETEENALQIQKLIEDKNITVNILKFTDALYYVCVPAINVTEYNAKAIDDNYRIKSI